MGNTHPHSRIDETSKASRRKLWRQRRLSDPSQNQKIKNCHLLPGSSLNTQFCTTPPTIKINGEASFDDSCSAESYAQQIRTKSASTDFSNLNTVVIDKPNASHRRKLFLVSTMNNSSIARSLDDSMIAKMSSVVRPKTPLKQLRTYSFRSLSSEENLMDPKSCELVADTWRLVEHRTENNFGCYALNRIIGKIPPLAGLFGVEQGTDLLKIGDTHPVRRHAKLLTNIIQLSVKGIDELEQQVAPTIFKYGERHYRPDISPHMTEDNIRLFCAQIVCTVFDFLEEHEASPKCAESWIEFMRYIGQKLIDGHEFARLSSEKKLSINRNDHHLFLML